MDRPKKWMLDGAVLFATVLVAISIVLLVLCWRPWHHEPDPNVLSLKRIEPFLTAEAKHEGSGEEAFSSNLIIDLLSLFP
jgi:hypothetical protein